MRQIIPALAVFAFVFAASAATNVSFDSMFKDPATDKPLIVNGLLFKWSALWGRAEVRKTHRCVIFDRYPLWQFGQVFCSIVFHTFDAKNKRRGALAPSICAGPSATIHCLPFQLP